MKIISYQIANDEENFTIVEKLINDKIDINQVGILFESYASITSFKEYLQRKNIPSCIDEVITWDDTSVRFAFDTLRYLSGEQDLPGSADYILFRMLHSKYFAIPGEEIALLAIETAARKYSLQPITWRQQLFQRSHRQPVDLFDKGLSEESKRVS